jgi:hypothetical protein
MSCRPAPIPTTQDELRKLITDSYANVSEVRFHIPVGGQTRVSVTFTGGFICLDTLMEIQESLDYFHPGLYRLL